MYTHVAPGIFHICVQVIARKTVTNVRSILRGKLLQKISRNNNRSVDVSIFLKVFFLLVYVTHIICKRKILTIWSS